MSARRLRVALDVGDGAERPVEQVEAAVAGWDRQAQTAEVPVPLAQQIAESMEIARRW